MSQIDRRQFGDGVAAFAMLLASGASAAPSPSPDNARAPHKMSDMPAHWRGTEKVAFLIYPGFTALDMVGPQYMFANLMGATIQIVGKSRDPIRSDTGIVFTPSANFEDAASNLDILCVPGGSTGTLAAMRDEETLAYIRAAGHSARYVTSVCTGSMLLGSAGLLDGYRATSHWVTKPLLPVFGATPAEGRFVRDRNQDHGGRGHRRFGLRSRPGRGVTGSQICRGRSAAGAICAGAAFQRRRTWNGARGSHDNDRQYVYWSQGGNARRCRSSLCKIKRALMGAAHDAAFARRARRRMRCGA